MKKPELSDEGRPIWQPPQLNFADRPEQSPRGGVRRLPRTV
jgi:hypothetical protein